MQKAPRRSPEEWQRIVTDLSTSGMSLKAYSELHQINHNTLIYWRQKLKKAKHPKPSFISLHQPEPTGLITGLIKINYNYNIELELPANYKVADLATLLKTLSC